MENQYDVVVAGAGAAGSVIARRLAEDPSLSVLLVEAGGGDDDGFIREAAHWVRLLGGEYDWGEVYAPGPHTAGRRIPIPRGRVVGGSSSINAMLWYRGHPDDYNAWEQAGAEGWNYASLLPYFKRSEDWQGGETEHRGTGGPMRIEVSQNLHPVAAAMLTGAEELGLGITQDPNAGDEEGASLANFNAVALPPGHPRAGTLERWSTARGYLRPASGWANLTILTGAEVQELRFTGSAATPRCTGLSCSNAAGERVEITARHGVVLTLGAFGTPRVLMRSGLGDAQALRRLGITPRVNLPGVGENFQDHPLLMGMNFRLHGPRGDIRDNGGGTMLNWRSAVADHRPDLHAFVVQGAHAGPDIAERYGIRYDDDQVCAISPGLMRSQSVGEIRMLDASGRLEIQPNYLAEPRDMEALEEAVDVILELAATSDYRTLISGPLSPGGRLSRAETREFIRQSCDTFFHCCGSAKMGIDEMSVVDPGMQVYGAEGLWVADASVIPIIPTCNIQAPVIAVAERAADLLHAEFGSSPEPQRSEARFPVP